MQENPMELRGILAPVLTPFTPAGEVDLIALERGVDYTIEQCHADAIEAAAVETQEYQFLSHEARKDLLRKTVEFVRGRRPVIAGISHPNPAVAIELAHHAEDLGAQAVQALVPLRPFGGQPTRGEVLRYFEALGNAARLPIVAYINPGPGAEVPPPLVVEIARLAPVRYFKESSRDLRRVARLIEEVDRAGHARFFTTMEMLLITLQLGGPGATMPPPAAKIGAEIVRAYTAGDLKGAIEAQRRFSLFPGRWMQHGLAPVMKAAMRLLGVDAGLPHPPFETLPPDEVRSLEKHLREIGLLQ
jgi:4-hydroxy-tetrahydrodipicolinate synthase